ncbi:MAG TPA: hypothetical protein VHO47_04425 [Candidatus Babeliales bacterium]|nr:hypothetical protein [Candidatus Babeliales bacterium]
MKYTSLRASCLITIGLIAAPALCVATVSADNAAQSHVNPVDKAVQILEAYAQQQKSFREFVDELIKMIQEHRETVKTLIDQPVPDKDAYIDNLIVRLESIKGTKNPIAALNTLKDYRWLLDRFKRYTGYVVSLIKRN